MLFFILFIVVLIGWIRATNKNKQVDKNSVSYKMGYADGFQVAKSNPETSRSYIDTADPVTTAPIVNPSVSAKHSELNKFSETGQLTNESDAPDQNVELDQTKNTSTSQPLAKPSPAINLSAKSVSGPNVMLLLGSLLFIAAGIAFIASPVSNSLKLLGILVGCGVFYGGGLQLYKVSTKLRPAAISFTGTGLALIPFLGVAFNAYTDLSPNNVWLLVSILGFVAYCLAAIVIKNQIISYFAIAFALSLSTSVTAIAQLSFVWYFAAFIGMSLVFSILSYFKPKWLPAVFQQPVSQTGDIVTPASIAASLIFIGEIELIGYELLFCLGAFYYIVAWLQTKKPAYEQAARALMHIGLWLIATDLVDYDKLGFGISGLILALAQQIYSLLRWPSSQNKTYEKAWLCIGFVLILAVNSFFTKLFNGIDMVMLSHVLAGIMAVATVLRTRQVSFGYIATYASLIVPTIIAYRIGQTPLNFEFMSLSYLAIGGLLLAAYHFTCRQRSLPQRRLVIITLSLHLLVAFFIASMLKNNLLSLSILTTLAGLVVALSLSLNKPYVMAVYGIMLTTVLTKLSLVLPIEKSDQLVTLGGSVIMSYLAMAIFWYFKDRTRGNIMLVAGHAYAIPALIALDTTLTRRAIPIHLEIVLALTTAWMVIVLVAARTDKNTPLRQIANSLMYVALYFTMAGFALNLSQWWQIAVLIVGVCLTLEASYAYKRPYVLILTNILLALTVANINAVLFPESQPWTGLAITATLAGVFYALYWLFLRLGDNQRRLIMFYSALTAVALGVMGWVGNDSTTIAAALLLSFGGMIVVIEGYLKNKVLTTEIGIYILALAITIMFSKIWPLLNPVFYAHLWAITIAAVAYWLNNNLLRYKIALGIITAVTGMMALAYGGNYSLLFLCEHVLLSAAGSLYKRNWVILWGVIASVLAIFYYLKESPFLVLALLGVSVTVFAVWRINRQASNK